MELRNEDECSTRDVRELSEGGRPKKDPEVNVGDLCSMHKGLAQFFDFRSMIGSKGVKCLKRRNGVKGMNTLDAKEALIG